MIWESKVYNSRNCSLPFSLAKGCAWHYPHVCSCCNLNTSGSNLTHGRKGPVLGLSFIPVQRWPGNQSTWFGIWPRAGSIWPHYLSSAESWPNSGSLFTPPELSMILMDPFPGHADPGVFEMLSYIESTVPTTIILLKEISLALWTVGLSLICIHLLGFLNSEAKLIAGPGRQHPRKNQGVHTPWNSCWTQKKAWNIWRKGSNLDLSPVQLPLFFFLSFNHRGIGHWGLRYTSTPWSKILSPNICYARINVSEFPPPPPPPPPLSVFFRAGASFYTKHPQPSVKKSFPGPWLIVTGNERSE